MKSVLYGSKILSQAQKAVATPTTRVGSIFKTEPGKLPEAKCTVVGNWAVREPHNLLCFYETPRGILLMTPLFTERRRGRKCLSEFAPTSKLRYKANTLLKSWFYTNQIWVLDFNALGGTKCNLTFEYSTLISHAAISPLQELFVFSLKDIRNSSNPKIGKGNHVTPQFDFKTIDFCLDTLTQTAKAA